MNFESIVFPRSEKGRICRPALRILFLLLLSLLILVPLVLIMGQSVWNASGFHPEGLLPELDGTDFFTLLWQTVLLGTAVSVVSLLMVFPLAFLSVKTDVGNQQWLDLLLLVPFMTPPYISAMSWVEFMQPNGFLQQLVPAAAGFASCFFSFWGLVTIMSLQVFPVIYLILKDTIRGIGDHIDEAAAVHGASFFYRLRRVYLPLVLPSCSAGLLLVFTKAISEFGAPATFGRSIGYNVMTTSIYQYVSNWPVDFGKASAISFWLMAVCLAVWKLQNSVSSRFSFNVRKSKEQYSVRYRLSGWKCVLARGYIGLVLAASIGIPYFSILAASFQKIQGNGLRFSNFTADHYRSVLSAGTLSLSALLTSLFISLIAATITVTFGFGVALWLASGKKGWFRRAVEGVCMLPNTVPGIVFLLGMISLWNSPWMPLHIYNTGFMVILAYVVLFLPNAVQYARSGIAQIDASLWEAGSLFSGRRRYLLHRIVLPLAGPHLLSAWALTFVFSMRELVASLLILPPGMQNAAAYIYAQFDQGSVSDGMALAVVSVAATSAVYALAHGLTASPFRRRRVKGRKAEQGK